eukprot:s2118_g7.t1
MVFPALCTVTDEHTIIMGHILQLGDSHIKRKLAGAGSEPEKIDTQVVKIQIYKDQLEQDWSTFVEAPVRCLLRSTEALQLCKGQQCGIDCAKHHPGVDETLDAVILEVWSRLFLNGQGKRVEASQAELFTVFLRLPEAAVHKLLLSVPPGVYAEPRGNQPREADAKLKQKYGIRVRKADEALAWTKLRPGVEFVDLSIQTIYELFPIPHGTQRHSINQILKDWAWKARVLQPGKGNHHHMAWRVGASEPPPASIMTAYDADVIITPVKDLQVQDHKPQIYATVKTQKQLRDQPASSTASKAASTRDPWLDSDPWGGYSKITSPRAPAASSHRAVLQDQLREDIRSVIKEERAKQSEDMRVDATDIYTTENEQRFTALESGLSELKQPNGHFMQWFKQTGDRMQKHEHLMQEVQENIQSHAGALQHLSATVQNTEKAIGEVHHTLNGHQQELHSIGANFKTAITSMKDEMMDSFNQQYGKLEALLEKRHKSN